MIDTDYDGFGNEGHELMVRKCEKEPKCSDEVYPTPLVGLGVSSCEDGPTTIDHSTSVPPQLEVHRSI
jgi:hypothetical protein